MKKLLISIERLKSGDFKSIFVYSINFQFDKKWENMWIEFLLKN